MSKLSPFFTEKAKSNFGEDESRKNQSLAQFREWLSKHPFIKGFNPSDVQLLAHLRACKYSMTNAFEQLEKLLIFIKTHEEWFKLSNEEYERAMELYETGFVKILKKRDSGGRKTIIFTSRLGDPTKYSGDDVFHLNCLVFPVLINEEENHICGINYINNSKDVTANHLSLFSIKKSFEALSNLKVFPVSVKNIFLIGVPQFAMQILQMAKYMLSDKMRERLHVLNDVLNLPDEISKSISMTEEDGGNKEVENIKEIFKKYLDFTETYLNFEIDMDKVNSVHNKKTFENIGSFRKLEID